MFRRAFDFLVFGTLLMLCVVMPNAFKEVAAGALVLAGLAGAVTGLPRLLNSRFMMFYLPSVVITVLYCVVGNANGAPERAMLEVPIIYIASPLLWALAWQYAIERYTLQRIVQWFIVGAWLAALSVAFYFFAFFTLGPEAVEFMVEEPNINVQGGYAAARMYVYGSEIFLLGGLLAAPSVVPNVLMRAALLIACFLVTLTSARGALILSMPLAAAVGLAAGMLSDPRRLAKLMVRSLLGLVIAAAAVVLVAWLLNAIWEIDYSLAVDELVEKLESLGGAGRSDQLVSLWDDIVRSDFMGVGHGISSYYTVSDDAPWRYEMVWLASVFRTGLLGALVYAAPFLFTTARAGMRLLRDQLTVHERFLFGGFFCAFIASNTNPYIEGVVFQWMYVLPVVYFLDVARRGLARAPSKRPQASGTGLKSSSGITPLSPSSHRM